MATVGLERIVVLEGVGRGARSSDRNLVIRLLGQLLSSILHSQISLQSGLVGRRFVTLEAAEAEDTVEETNGSADSSDENLPPFTYKNRKYTIYSQSAFP